MLPGTVWSGWYDVCGPRYTVSGEETCSSCTSGSGEEPLFLRYLVQSGVAGMMYAIQGIPCSLVQPTVHRGIQSTVAGTRDGHVQPPPWK